jgi:hypothetical protein
MADGESSPLNIVLLDGHVGWPCLCLGMAPTALSGTWDSTVDTNVIILMTQSNFAKPKEGVIDVGKGSPPVVELWEVPTCRRSTLASPTLMNKSKS